MRTLYTNCIVHSKLDGNTFSFLGVEKGKVVYLGSNRPEGKWNEVDLEGAHIAPRMIDSHMHMLYTMVLAAQSFFISEIKDGKVVPTNPKGALERLHAYSEEHPKSKLIVANGFIPSVFENPRLLTRQELDEAAPGKAVIVYTIDGHSSTLSSVMLERLGMDLEAEKDGIMRGERHEFMQGKVTSLIASSLTPSILARGVANFVNETRRLGLSGVVALDGQEDDPKDLTCEILSRIATKLPMDIVFYPQYQDFDRAKKIFPRQKRRRIGGCQAWELDGAVNSQSAAFYTPYRDMEETGHTYYSDEHIRERVETALKEDILLTSHAIGPVAIDQILNVYDEHRDELPTEKGMYRIDHFEFPSRNAMEKIKGLDIALTFQPGFSYIDKRFLKSYTKYLTDEQLSLIAPLKTLDDMGVCILGSSDSPVQELDPYLQMKGMTAYYVEKESLSPRSAYRSYSLNAGKAIGEDFSLEVGNEASFNVYSKDIEEKTLDKSDLLFSVNKGKRVKMIKHPMLFLLSLPFRRKHTI